jgi:glycosyltransferase involved in cell wall biosynthesis
VAQNDFDIGIKAKVVKKGKSVVIHNGVDADKFSTGDDNIEFKIKLKKENDTIIIGSIGRLHYQKGYEYLIEASVSILKNYPQAKFVLIGEGELRDSLEFSAKKKGVYNSFIFLGNQTEIPELLKQIDIFVLPSLWEGLPLVLLEAMASKKPIVATDVNGITEIIHSEEEGILVPSKNSAALSSAILRLLKNDELRERIASKGYIKVMNEFHLNKMIEKTESVYLKYVHN